MIEGDNHHTEGEPKEGENLDNVVRATSTDEGLGVANTPARQSATGTDGDTGATGAPEIRQSVQTTDENIGETVDSPMNKKDGQDMDEDRNTSMTYELITDKDIKFQMKRKLSKNVRKLKRQ